MKFQNKTKKKYNKYPGLGKPGFVKKQLPAFYCALQDDYLVFEICKKKLSLKGLFRNQGEDNGTGNLKRHCNNLCLIYFSEPDFHEV